MQARPQEASHGQANELKLGTLWGYVGDEDTALYLYASTGKKRGQREGELSAPPSQALRRQPSLARERRQWHRSPSTPP